MQRSVRALRSRTRRCKCHAKARGKRIEGDGAHRLKLLLAKGAHAHPRAAHGWNLQTRSECATNSASVCKSVKVRIGCSVVGLSNIAKRGRDR